MAIKQKRKEELITLAATWRRLNAKLPELNEEEVSYLLNQEVTVEQRLHYFIRLHARFTKLRNHRERDEYLENMGF